MSTAVWGYKAKFTPLQHTGYFDLLNPILSLTGNQATLTIYGDLVMISVCVGVGLRWAETIYLSVWVECMLRFFWPVLPGWLHYRRFTEGVQTFTSSLPQSTQPPSPDVWCSEPAAQWCTVHFTHICPRTHMQAWRPPFILTITTHTGSFFCHVNILSGDFPQIKCLTAVFLWPRLFVWTMFSF